MNNDVNRLSVQDYPQYNIINSSQPSWPSPNSNTNSQSPNTKVKTIEECGRWEFSCGSGECIAIYDTCNGIAQCADGSDEDTEYCSEYTSTTKKKPGARLRTTPTPVLAPSNNRSVERENKKTSYPKWLNKLPDAAKSGGKSGVDTANLASDDDIQISSETGVIPGYKILDYKDTVIEEIGDKIISSHHSLLSTLAFIFAMALLSFALVVGFKAIRHRTFLYRSSQLLDSPNFMRGARQERRVLLSGDDDYDDLNL